MNPPPTPEPLRKPITVTLFFYERLTEAATRRIIHSIGAQSAGKAEQTLQESLRVMAPNESAA